jgi:O-antigen biosynthesis protein
MLAPLPIRERPAQSAGPAAQVVVLGMHRSGTSALTGLLRLLGLWAGDADDFPPADDHNQAGYWEHRGVWSVDEAILRALGASWSEIADLDLSRLGKALRTRLRERAQEIVRDLDRHGSWVIKDPRLCLLFPFWREILEHPRCVLIYREPLPVARSLAARDGIPVPYGIALWEQYTREALASTRSLPRVLISHRELMDDPAAILLRLHDKLFRLDSSDPGRLQLPTVKEIRAVVDPALVHHPPEPEIERQYLTPPQLDLLDALATGSALDLDPIPPLSPGARDLLAAYQSLPATTRDLHQAFSRLDELDAIFSAILDSRSWKIGNTITAAIGRFLGRSATSAPERRDRLMAEVRSWQQRNSRK